jgi:DNA-binding NarL/FixJ family response regulator
MSKRETGSYRILVVDDHAIVRQGLAMLLASEPEFEICGEAGTIAEAETEMARTQPDMLIVDITLKEENGLELIPRALERNPDLKTLVLSMHEESDYVEQALRAGAQGYVMKENADEVIVDAMKTVAAGQIYVSPETASSMMRAHVGAGPGVEKAGSEGVDSLTEREKEVFRLIGEGLTTKAIAEGLGLSARTVEVHRAHIKKKLGCDSAAQVFREAVRWVEKK